MAGQRLGAAEWAVLIDQWRQSGLSLPEFCRSHGLSRCTMQNWAYKPALKIAVEEARRAARAGRDAPAGTGRPQAPTRAFLPVRLAGTDAPKGHTAIEVILGRGRRVAVGPGFDPETLRRVVDTLEG